MDPVTKKLLLFVFIIAFSFGVGYAIAAALRLKEYATKLGLLLFTIALAASPFLNKSLVDGKPWYEALRFGIDLAGGTNLVYQLTEPPGAGKSDLLARTVGAVRKRIDPAGTQELVVRQVGSDKLEIIIPKATPEAIANIKRRMLQVGKLEFSILAATWDTAHQEIIRQARQVPRDVRTNNKVVAGWRPIAPIVHRKADGKPERLPNTEFGTQGVVTRQIKGQPEGFLEVLVVFEPNKDRQVTGEYLSRAQPGMDQRGRPSIDFTFTSRGGYLFGQLTGRYKPRDDGNEYRLAVLLDDEVQTAPNLQTRIETNGQITGNFSNEEINNIVTVLNAGALDIPLKKDPVSEFSISPLLGVDVQQKGITAIVVATLGVLAFMAVYYLVLGLVADLCLVLNLILLVGAMAFIEATFTLPGLAGIVLTMGMAVDANVLIYERMREEMEHGSSMRMAIHNGFSKAFSAIFDSNITTLLTAVILYVIGTEQIKGFAVSLFIGLAVSMYTALTVNRLVLEIIERKRWVKKFKTMNPFGVTNYDFVGKQKICAIGSIALIAAGLVTFFVRGTNNYDIDFTGGTMVTMRFVDQQTADDVRQKLATAFQSDVTVEQLTSTDPAQNGKTYRMRTIEQDENKVMRVINETFPDMLIKVSLKYDALKPIPVEKPVVKPGEPEPEPNPFAGGYQTELSFSAPTRLDTAERYITNEMADLKNDKGEPKFGQADQTSSLVKFEGVGDPAPGQAVAAFDKMKLQIRQELTESEAKEVLQHMQQTMANSPSFDEVNSFEASIAFEAKKSAVIAMLASLIMIVAYVWWRFENLYFGLAAVLALAHDVLVTLGMVVMASAISTSPVAPLLLLSDFKINMTMIAAFLTIVGYSLNDTIVIFDRLREIRGKNPKMDKEMINLAVNQTFSRTILTAGTVFITVAILYGLGGEGIHGFAYAMLIGTIVGCYSTIYVASPAVLALMEYGLKKSRPVPTGKQPKMAGLQPKP